MDTLRIERERDFHNLLAESGFENRKLINRLSASFYSKDDESPLWGPVWHQIDLCGKQVLDYGCGDGRFSLELARRGANVDGIDISESVVDLAAHAVSQGMADIRFSARDAHETGFDDASFDYVFGNGILHHLELEKAYREVARVLKPGGQAFFMEPMQHHPLLALLRKATPASRSVDEKPLSMTEIDMARRVFQQVRLTEHFLIAVLGAPMHLASKRAALRLIRCLDRVDRIAIKVMPSLGRYAWLSMLELGKA